MSDECVIYLHSTFYGHGPADQSWLVEYDPRAKAKDWTPGTHCLLRWTRDPAEAKRFPDKAEALRYYRQGSGRMRLDGKPDRPLTAYTITIHPPGEDPRL